jgi:hypothetical protein
MKYDEAYIATGLHFAQFRRFVSHSLETRRRAEWFWQRHRFDTLFIQDSHRSDIFSAAIDAYLMPLLAASDNGVSVLYRVHVAEKLDRGDFTSLKKDFVDKHPFDVIRPEAWITWSQTEKDNFRKGSPVVYFPMSKIGSKARECSNFLFSEMKLIVIDGVQPRPEMKKAIYNSCSLQEQEEFIFQCPEEYPKASIMAASPFCQDAYVLKEVIPNEDRINFFRKLKTLANDVLIKPPEHRK